MAVKFVVVDIETTGLSVTDGAILEIGAVKLEEGQAPEEFQTLIHPRVPIEPQALAAHGITAAVALAEGLPPTQAFERFAQFVGDLPLVAHNGISFDFPFLSYDCKRHGILCGENPLFDTLLLARRFLTTRDGSFRLQSLCDSLGIHNTRAHRAIGDVRATAEVFQHILKDHSNWEELWQYSYSFTLRSLGEVPEGYPLLSEALRVGRQLRIEYASAGQPSRERWILPRTLTVTRNGLKQINALCLESNIEKQFRLDRIKRLIEIK